MMNAAKELMTGAGVVCEGHYVLNSGLHAPLYVNKDLTSCDPETLDKLAQMMAEEVAKTTDFDVDVVVGAMEGSAVLANRVAEHLGKITGRKVQAVWASKKGDGFTFRSTYAQIIKGSDCIQVEDIITSGKAARQVRDCITEADGFPGGISCLWSRGGQTAESLGFGWMVALVDEQVEAQAYPCDQCKEGTPINTDLGHGQEFMEEHPEYPKLRFHDQTLFEQGHA